LTVRTHGEPDCEPALEWQVDVSLLGQPTMVANFAKVIAIAVVVMSGLLIFLSIASGNSAPIWPTAQLTLACVGFVAVLFLFVIVVFFRNRMTMRFAVDERGAQSAQIDRRARAGANAAIVAGALSGKPGLLGAGLISQSSSSQTVRWSAVRSARFSPRWRAIKLANGWRAVMVLYCLPQNYENVAEWVRRALASNSPSRERSPLAGYLLRTALVVVASAPLFNLPTPIHVEAFVPFLILCFALASIWLIPILGWVVLGGLAWLAFEIAVVATSPYHSLISDETFPLFRLMGDDDWIGAALALVGAAYLAWLSYALLRGRTQSAFARDMDEMGG